MTSAKSHCSSVGAGGIVGVGAVGNGRKDDVLSGVGAMGNDRLRRRLTGVTLTDGEGGIEKSVSEGV